MAGKDNLFEYVNASVREVEEDKCIVSRDEALRRLRGLDNFGAFLLTMPNAEYPKLSKLLPAMASDEVQRNWTGNSGIALLKQSTTFIRSMIYNYALLTGRGLDDAHVLDYGCGYGRLARLMYAFIDPDRFYGVDPWTKSIELCKEAGLETNLFVSDYLPTTLPVGAARFDLIYAFSVFTHLSERAIHASLRTLRRYVSHEGVLIITIRPVEYWSHDPHTSASERERQIEQHRETGFSFHPHIRESIDGDITYGDTSMTLEWLARMNPDWKIRGTDHSLEDPMQRYVFYLLIDRYHVYAPLRAVDPDEQELACRCRSMPSTHHTRLTVATR